jgi:hypothetical protein
MEVSCLQPSVTIANARALKKDRWHLLWARRLSRASLLSRGACITDQEQRDQKASSDPQNLDDSDVYCAAKRALKAATQARGAVAAIPDDSA